MKQKWEPVQAEKLVRNGDSGTYYLRARVNGKLLRRSLRTDKLREAKVRRDELLARLEADAVRPADVSLERLLEMVHDYYAAIPSYQVKPRSMQYRDYMLEILGRTLPDRPVEWTAAGLRAWWAGEDVVRYSAGVRNNALGTLQKACALLMEGGWITVDPSRGLDRVPLPRREVWVPSREQFAAVVEEMHTQPRALDSALMVEWMAYTGMRHGETKAVRWADVGSDEIVVGGGVAGTKNHDVRRVPITRAMRGLLARMERGEDGERVFYLDSPKRALNRAAAVVGCVRMTPHVCRHYFATCAIESGVDIPTVARWLGHKDGGALAMRTYGHLRRDHSVQAAARVDL